MSYRDNSSYTKISRNLVATAEAQELLNDIILGLSEAEIVGYQFFLKKSDDMADARVVYEIKVGSQTTKVDIDDTPKMIPHLGRFIDEKKLEKVIGLYWKQEKFPTYFCKKNQVLHGGSRGVGFTRMMMESINSRLDGTDVLEKASNRLLDQKAKLEASEDFQNERAAFLKKNATEDIGKVMKLYNHLGDDVLREALQDFVVNFTLEI